jgi:hypothetical protein
MTIEIECDAEPARARQRQRAGRLADIRNTQRINAVISNGQLFERKALNQIVAQAKTNQQRT